MRLGRVASNMCDWRTAGIFDAATPHTHSFTTLIRLRLFTHVSTRFCSEGVGGVDVAFGEGRFGQNRKFRFSSVHILLVRLSLRLP